MIAFDYPVNSLPVTTRLDSAVSGDDATRNCLEALETSETHLSVSFVLLLLLVLLSPIFGPA